MAFSRFVLIAGLSGAGKSQAMKSFEDLAFYCLDNLPPALVDDLVTLAERAGVERIALSLDVRARGPLGQALAALDRLAARGLPFEVLYLEASDEAIVRRYSETRHRHPLEERGNLAGAIALERRALEPLRARADHIWNTSALTQAALKDRIREFAQNGSSPKVAVNVIAFGFKFGIPLHADLVFDVRFLRNPNYEPELKNLTGADRAVVAFMEGLPDTEPFLLHLFALIDFLVPRYVLEGKSRLTIAIGCTGGQHRSVYIAAKLADHLAKSDAVAVTREYRELAAL